MESKHDCDTCLYEPEPMTSVRCQECLTNALDDYPGWTAKDKSAERVDHPSHYNREGSMECIDEMVLVFGVQATVDFCLLNSWKYRYRAADKNGEEDMRKSDWYLRKMKELCEQNHIITKINVEVNNG